MQRRADDGAELAFSELVPRPVAGRVYEEPVRTRIDDAAASGRIRLDALARWLQDAAYWDLVDAGWEAPDPWFVRRLRLRVERFPAYAERVHLATWCSGLGRAVAERRTSITGDRGAAVEAVALWVHVDPGRGRPAPLPERFLGRYAEAAGERRVRTGLGHPTPPEAPGDGRAFVFRAADVDPAAHVNNAAYWSALEEELTDASADRGLDAEVEHRGALLPGRAVVYADGPRRWVAGADGTVAASFLLDRF